MMHVFDTMTFRRWLVPAVVLTALAACETPDTDASALGGFGSRAAQDDSNWSFDLPTGIPAEERPLFVFWLNQAAAQELALNCPVVEFDDTLARRNFQGMIRGLENDDTDRFDRERTVTAIEQFDIAPQVAAYGQTRGLTEGDVDGVCAAAGAEISSGSGIGSLLQRV